MSDFLPIDFLVSKKFIERFLLDTHCVEDTFFSTTPVNMFDSKSLIIYIDRRLRIYLNLLKLRFCTIIALISEINLLKL